MENIVSRERAAELLAYVRGGFAADMAEDNVCRMIKQSITDFNYDERSLVMEFSDCAWMKNAAGGVHGGMQGLCIDTATGTLVSILCDVFAPTMSASLTYLHPVPSDGKFSAKVYAVHLGKTAAHIRAEVYADGSDKVLATATAIHFVGTEKGLERQMEDAAKGVL